MNPFKMFLLFLNSIIQKLLWLTSKHNYTHYLISGNTFTDNTYGLWINADSTDHVFYNNTATNCSTDFHFDYNGTGSV